MKVHAAADEHLELAVTKGCKSRHGRSIDVASKICSATNVVAVEA